ncbi:Hypothetical Protein SiL_1730 [Sulfolobus islandicus LAL14/1]|uniref:Uncharacterized protein n=1 Tax=Saccharolobus islandicus LAL14/1 TaxID=1241935 RepID=M9UEY6_SACIS|nr:Hypothetical Protein SiL_1730 [Sulfolobus islandicus LAL14/1]
MFFSFSNTSSSPPASVFIRTIALATFIHRVLILYSYKNFATINVLFLIDFGKDKSIYKDNQQIK